MVLTEAFPLSRGAATPGHKHGDFSDFMVSDFMKYEMQGELVFDAQFSEINDTEKLGKIRLPVLRKSHMKKKQCQELSPIDGNPYGDPYGYYEVIGDFEWFSLNDMFRQEMRAVMEQIGLKVREDQPLEEIVTLEERKKEYADYVAENERKAEEARLERERKQKEAADKRAIEESEKLAQKELEEQDAKEKAAKKEESSQKEEEPQKVEETKP